MYQNEWIKMLLTFTIFFPLFIPFSSFLLSFSVFFFQNNDQGLCAKYEGFKCVDQNISGLYTMFDIPFREAGYEVGILGRVDILKYKKK